MSIVDIVRAKRRLQIDLSDTTDDDELISKINAITPVIEEYKDEIIDKRAFTEQVDVNGSKFRLNSTPVISLTSVTSLDGNTHWDISNLNASPNGLVRVIGGPPITGAVEVVYLAGYENVPYRYVEGALVILQHVWETQRGVAGDDQGVLGPEEEHPRATSTFSFPHKALEWLGPRPPVGA